MGGWRDTAKGEKMKADTTFTLIKKGNYAGKIIEMVREGMDPSKTLVLLPCEINVMEVINKIKRITGLRHISITFTTIRDLEMKIVADGWRELGFGKEPALVETEKIYALIARILSEDGMEWETQSQTRNMICIAADVFNTVRRARANGLDLSQEVACAAFCDRNPDETFSRLVSLYDRYKARMKEEGYMTLDDLKASANEFLNSHPGYMSEHYQFRHVILSILDFNSDYFSLISGLTEAETFEELTVFVYG